MRERDARVARDRQLSDQAAARASDSAKLAAEADALQAEIRKLAGLTSAAAAAAKTGEHHS